MSQTPDELLTLLEERAPRLRAAGVLEIDVRGLRARLAPPDPPPLKKEKIEPEVRLNPLDDPRTYGLPPGAKLPGIAWDPSQEPDS
jgi:hypothetical protein